MPFTAQEVLHRARLTLNDANTVRWTLPELLVYLNDAVRDIALQKPDAVSDTVEISLSEGTWQTLGASHIALLRVVRNLVNVQADPGGRTGGSAITPTERATLDQVMPGWQNPSVLAFSTVVDHVIHDEADPRSFYVVPGNDGTGIIEAIVAVMPTEIPEPANPLQIDSYTATVDLPEIYRGPVVDYVLHKAFSKDSADPANANRAVAHYNAFANALGLKTQAEMAHNPDTARA